MIPFPKILIFRYIVLTLFLNIFEIEIEGIALLLR